MEEFYSIQGEGFHTGKAAYFIRVGGCDAGCHWCDVKESWDAALHPLVAVDEMLERIASCPAKAVVITGGEPLLYNLSYLCHELSARSIETFLETSGSHPLQGKVDWICLSPKKSNPPVGSVCSIANELKVVIASEADFAWAEKQSRKVNEQCMLFLQPEWSRSKQMMPCIVDYILEHPKWQMSLQSHKYMRIP